MEEARRKIKDRCLEKEEPFCASVCPFHLDVREFISRMQRGSFNAAFRIFSNTVGFPAIVAALCDEPCKRACPRSKTDAPISLNLLERAAIAHASNTKPNSYNMPFKKGRIAVVGAGISGLACALRLSNRKYHVAVFEQNGRIGGRLWELLDEDIFLGDIQRQFMYEEYEFFLNTPIHAPLDLLSDFDAVYVATGADGSFSELTENIGDMKSLPFATHRPGVFMGGSLLGAGSLEAMSHGLKAANCIEGYLKTGNMKSAEKNPPTKMRLDPAALTAMEPVIPADGVCFSKKEAAAEAARCIKCRCDACVRHCAMMTYFRKFPERIADEVEITVNPGTLDGNGTVATRLISACNQCGLCGEICPEHIDMGDFLRKSHHAMRAKGAMPWAYHEFWLRDMDFANGERASLSLPAPGYDRCGALFFPGCQLGASDPRYVIESYRFLLGRKPDTALSLGCCGAPAIWAGDQPRHRAVCEKIREEWRRLGEPQVILACPTCLQMFGQYLPEIQSILLFDILSEWGIVPAVQEEGAVASVFDPCATRHRPESQRTIRRLAETAGYRLVPLPYEGNRAQCCSHGGQISIANSSYTQRLVEKRIEEGDAPYIVYCSNCRDIFAHAGKPVRHILDILFGLNDWRRGSPTFDMRRQHREQLKLDLLREFWPEMAVRRKEEKMRHQKKLIIGEHLREKMDRERFLEEDAAAVIEECESEGRKVFAPSTEHWFGCREIGFMTYWVEYAPCPDGYILFNAYSHRMKIDLEDAGHEGK